jgi:hypothetical protein
MFIPNWSQDWVCNLQCNTHIHVQFWHIILLFVPLDFPVFLTISFACLLNFTIFCTIIFSKVDQKSQLHFNDSILGNVPINVVEMGQSKWLFFFWHIPKQTRGVSHSGLAIYIKSQVKAKDELWKLKYFTMQKYNL